MDICICATAGQPVLALQVPNRMHVSCHAYSFLLDSIDDKMLKRHLITPNITNYITLVNIDGKMQNTIYNVQLEH